MPHRILISLGSNNRQNAHIQWATQRLTTFLSSPHFSRIIWTHDHSGTTKMYMNRLASGTTDLTPDEIVQKLKVIEVETNRTPDTVTIDLDLMAYDTHRYHLRDWPRPYIHDLLDSTW